MAAQSMVACQFDLRIHRSAQSSAVILNGLDATFVGRGAEVSVDQTVSNGANIHILRSGDTTDIRVLIVHTTGCFETSK